MSYVMECEHKFGENAWKEACFAFYDMSPNAKMFTVFDFSMKCHRIWFFAFHDMSPKVKKYVKRKTSDTSGIRFKDIQR